MKFWKKEFNFCKRKDNKPQSFFVGMMEALAWLIYGACWLFYALFTIYIVILAFLLYKFHILVGGVIALIIWLKFFRKKK